VIKDARNTERSRVACRDEAELQRVKEAAKKTAVNGVRVLRDQLHQVKVDNEVDMKPTKGQNRNEDLSQNVTSAASKVV
jgi:hypothetical protein